MIIIGERKVLRQQQELGGINKYYFRPPHPKKQKANFS